MMPPMPDPISPDLAFAAHDHAHCAHDALERAEALTRASGARMTPVRRRVLEILLEEHKALGAYDVLALFERMVERDLCRTIPVIFLTGHADLPTAVDAVKRGAFDFCEKPVSDNALVDRIEQALAQSEQVMQQQAQRDSFGRMLAGLTEREQAVMRLMLDGLPNKLIADQLGISVRTVEVHRARVFDKMKVKSAVELANALQQR